MSSEILIIDDSFEASYSLVKSLKDKIKETIIGLLDVKFITGLGSWFNNNITSIDAAKYIIIDGTLLSDFLYSCKQKKLKLSNLEAIYIYTGANINSSYLNSIISLYARGEGEKIRRDTPMYRSYEQYKDFVDYFQFKLGIRVIFSAKRDINQLIPGNIIMREKEEYEKV